jgi:hypothetical protein
MIRKVLALTLNYDHPQTGQVLGLEQVFGSDNVVELDYLALQRAGADVESVFVETTREFQPDWVWMQLQDTGVVSAEAIERARKAWPEAVFTHWTGDYRPSISPYMASISQACDATFISSRGQLAQFFNHGASNVSYVQIGLDWYEDVLGLPDWTPPFKVPDVVFIGNYYADGPWPKGTAERLEAVRALQRAHVDFGVVGTGWPADVRTVGTCTVKQQHHVWKRAKVCVNVNHANDVENYYSDRMLIALASGNPVVTKYVPGLEHEFSEGEDIVWFDEADELVRHVKYLLENKVEAREIGRAGRQRAMREHSWYVRFLDLLPEVEALRRRTCRPSNVIPLAQHRQRALATVLRAVDRIRGPEVSRALDDLRKLRPAPPDGEPHT